MNKSGSFPQIPPPPTTTLGGCSGDEVITSWCWVAQQLCGLGERKLQSPERGGPALLVTHSVTLESHTGTRASITLHVPCMGCQSSLHDTSVLSLSLP